jgi:hypothetical protein
MYHKAYRSVCDSDQVLIAVLKSLPATEFLLQLTACQEPTIKLGCTRDCHILCHTQCNEDPDSWWFTFLYAESNACYHTIQNYVIQNPLKLQQVGETCPAQRHNAAPCITKENQSLPKLHLRVGITWHVLRPTTNWAHDVLHDHVQRNHTHWPGFWMYTSTSQLS